MARKLFRSLKLIDLESELVGVERWLYNLRHSRGRWPRQWCKGMIRHYDDRRMKLRATISRIEREQAEKRQRTRKG